MMKRIEALRRAALSHRHGNDEFFYRFYKQYGRYDGTPELPRYADALYRAFSELTPRISSGELIVGAVGDGLCTHERAEWESTYREIAAEASKRAGGGQDSHMAIDYELVLSQGLSGIIRRIDRYAAECRPEQADFYAAARISLLAVIEHSRRYADCARRLAESEGDPVRRAELLEIASVCERVPAEPARSFYEAVQSVHFVTYCLSLNPLRFCFQQFQLGHPDRYLLRYYEAGLADGSLTEERARLLLDCLCIQINMRVPSGLSSGYMVGGRDGDGRIVENRLTELLIRAVEDVRLVYPSVGLCYTEGMSDSILAKACEILSHGRSHPAIFNDDVITRGLMSYGVPESEAHEYIHSTCVEITPTASSNVWVASPYTNLAGLLLETMNEEHGSFESLLSAFYARLDERVRSNFEAQNAARRHRAAHSVNPLLSCFVNDCLARGVDIERGGARYNWIMPSFVGMANLVDSLYAVKTLVYDEGRLTLSQFKEILDADFEGNEPLRRHLLRDLPKYGNDIDGIDRYAVELTEHITAECEKYKAIHTGGDLIPSVFCWIMHERFGRGTGATPDGRRAGFPLGDGSGPCQGRELRGPTASILSSTKWRHERLIGGVAVNMKFSKSALGADSLGVMLGLIKAYLARGGFELQINVTDRQILERAREDPEQYRDLVVRIGGYSDYFTRLSPEMQNELILRTEHRI